MEHVLSRVTNKHVHTHPYTYILIEGAIDESLCDELIAKYPPIERVAGNLRSLSNRRYNYSPKQVLEDKEMSSVWKEFIKVNTSRDFFSKLVGLLGKYVYDTYPDFKKRFGSLDGMRAGVDGINSFSTHDILLSAFIGGNTPVTDDPTSVKEAHLDGVHKLYGGLLYLRHPEDDSTGGDFEIYRYKNNRYSFYGQRFVRPKYVQTVATVPYRKNTFVLFVNSVNALHGITVRQKTSHARMFMNLVGQFDKPLFSIDDRKESVIEKVIRKLSDPRMQSRER